MTAFANSTYAGKVEHGQNKHAFAISHAAVGAGCAFIRIHVLLLRWRGVLTAWKRVSRRSSCAPPPPPYIALAENDFRTVWCSRGSHAPDTCGRVQIKNKRYHFNLGSCVLHRRRIFRCRSQHALVSSDGSLVWPSLCGRHVRYRRDVGREFRTSGEHRHRSHFTHRKTN